MDSLTPTPSPSQLPIPITPKNADNKTDPASLNLSAIINKYDIDASNNRLGHKKIALPHGELEDIQSITETAKTTLPIGHGDRLENLLKNIFTLICKFINTIKSPSTGIKAFNKNADKIKSAYPNWRQHVGEHVKKLTDEEVLTIIEMPIRNLRGMDREFLHSIYSVINENISDGALTTEQLKKLDDRVKYFQTMVIDVSEENMKCLGGGAVNKVHLIKYKDSPGADHEGIFKPDLEKMPAWKRFKEANFGAATAAGIPTGKKGFYSDRSVAFSKVDRLIGFDISVKTEFAIVNGQRGILMAKANPGKVSTTSFTKKTIHNFNPNRTQNLATLPEEKKDPYTEAYVNKFIMERLGATRGNLNERDLNFLGSIYGCRDVKLEKDDQGWTIVGNFPEFENFYYNNPKTVEGLTKLQLLDFIMGQVDRHPYNYNIDKDGTVMAFDNDASAGVKSTPNNFDAVRDQSALAFFIPNNSSLILRPPNVVTLEMCDQVNNLCINIKALEDLLKDHLEDEEINGVLLRLQHLAHHINNFAMVVPDKNDLISMEAKKIIDSNNSYAEVLLKNFDSAQEGWNYLRAHRKIPQYQLDAPPQESEA
ncbi:MAG: hypothetical protein H0U49_09030 [Parachlamydiaceae bacterium]|nr:hypothetical protein [Parachlamydiaceae bacterium]